MSAAEPKSPGSCHVVDEAKLPEQAGGGKALCRAIEQAVAARKRGLRYSVEVKVVSKTMLSAKMSARGRNLPEQKFAVMDKELDGLAFEQFARAIAKVLASA